MRRDQVLVEPKPQEAPAPQKIGSGALQAFLRQGVKELGVVLGKATPETPQVDEPGQLWSVTPQLATEQMTGRQVNLEMDR